METFFSDRESVKPATPKNKYELLADQIAKILSAEIVLDKRTMDFIDATLAAPSADALAEILSDSENSEADAVYQLLFFPDESIQERLEPILEQNTYDDQGGCAVIDLLMQKQLQTRIRLPERDAEIPIRIPDSALRRFVLRLHITRHIDQQVSQTLARCIPDKKEVCRIRVRLRNARFTPAPETQAFLCRFIENIYPSKELFEQALPLVLDLLDQTPPETEIDAALMVKRQRCLRMLHQAAQIDRALAGHSVEALMLQGISIPAINIEEIRKNIDTLDRVCALMSLSADPENPPQAPFPA
jgi:hypothetical protein